MLAGLRLPPQLMRVVQQNAGGFGSSRDTAVVFAANEVEPIQAHMLHINEAAGEEAIRIKPTRYRRPIRHDAYQRPIARHPADFFHL